MVISLKSSDYYHKVVFMYFFITLQRRKHFNYKFWGRKCNHKELILGVAPRGSNPSTSACEAEAITMSYQDDNIVTLSSAPQ